MSKQVLRDTAAVIALIAMFLMAGYPVAGHADTNIEVIAVYHQTPAAEEEARVASLGVEINRTDPRLPMFTLRIPNEALDAGQRRGRHSQRTSAMVAD